MSTLIRRVLFLVAFFVVAGAQSVSAGINASAVTGSKPLQILFIGNSYTFFNDLPVMLSEMSNSLGNTRGIQTKMVAVPAATLQQLWDIGDAARAINEGQWDIVVLQEQSILPMVEPEKMKLYARKFDNLIKERGAKTALYVTWARKAKPEMQTDLNSAYYSLAKEIGALVVPVGTSWQIALATDSSIGLYTEDGSHPTPTGTYLAACTFYQVFIKDVVTCPLPGDKVGVKATDLAVVRAASKQAISMLH